MPYLALFIFILRRPFFLLIQQRRKSEKFLPKKVYNIDHSIIALLVRFEQSPIVSNSAVKRVTPLEENNPD